VDDTRDITQNRQQDVDEEIGIATSLEEDTKGWEDDGKDDLADVAVVGPCVSKRRCARKMTEAFEFKTYDAVKGMVAFIDVSVGD
jgi:hypothetical protein